MKSKRTVEGIDETFLRDSITEQDLPVKTKNAVAEQAAEVRETVEPVEPAAEKPKEPPVKRRRSASDTDYSNRFLQRNGFKARQCVYISQRIHATISEIVRVMPGKEVTVGGYIDSILMEHLELHREEITGLYKRELEKKNSRNLMEF